LAAILRAQGKYGDETRGLYERLLAIFIRNNGPDGQNSAIGNYSLGLFHYQLALKQNTVTLQQTQLLLAKSNIEEALRIYSKLHGPNHQVTINAASQLALISSELSTISLA
jgi:hypothetical protein